MYDTFHEPFKRVSSRPTGGAPETPTKDNDKENIIVEPPPVDGSTVVEGSKLEAIEAEKELNLNVKSALSAAFAKYADRFQKPEGKSSLPEKE